jgi:hypothetical protein
MFKHKALLAAAFVVVALGAAGIAYATIPDGGGVYTACMLKNVGTIRLIDPSLGSASLMGHCTSLETQISWNQQGPPGINGTNGTNGTNGVSPTVAQLAAGDSHCAAGGAALTDASGNTAYVCNPSLTSPDGNYSISVGNDGILLNGTSNPGVHLLLNANGLEIKSNTQLKIEAGTNGTLRFGADGKVEASGVLTLKGAMVNINP